MLTAQDLPPQGLGCMTMRDDNVGDPDRDPAAVVNAALDAGVTMVDTAHSYGNEALVGRAIAVRRDEVLLATKFGVLWRDDGISITCTTEATTSPSRRQSVRWQSSSRKEGSAAWAHLTSPRRTYGVHTASHAASSADV